MTPQTAGFWVGALAGAVVAVALIRLLSRVLRAQVLAGPRLAVTHSNPGSHPPRRPPAEARRAPGPGAAPRESRTPEARTAAPPARAARRWPFVK